MSYAKVPGCKDCGRTSHGGRTRDLVVEQAQRYEVVADGEVIGRFASVVAASTFMRGHPRSVVRPIQPFTEPTPLHIEADGTILGHIALHET